MKKKKYEEVPFQEVDENGETVYNIDADAANADWIRAARLKRKAEQGDEEAAKELEKRQNTKMVRVKIRRGEIE